MDKKSLKTVVLIQILVEVTGFEPATFWSRILSSVGHPIPARPVESCCDWICSDGKVLLTGEICIADDWTQGSGGNGQLIPYSASLLV